MRGANEETYFGGWRRADALGLAPHVDAFAAPGARVGAARVERLGLEAVTLVVAVDVDAVAVLTTRVGAARVARRWAGRQQHAVDDVHDAVARLDVDRHNLDAIHKDAIAVDLEAQLEAGKRLDAEAVREVLRKHLARNDVVQQDGLELLRLEQLLGRDAQFADQVQKVLILGGEDTGVGLGSELR